ncbi:MAG: hypothetical protein HOQ05_09845 [Corynebacteriales bacterium]|nr:hypothetical protein [Mycobacteriales bacterium]
MTTPSPAPAPAKPAARPALDALRNALDEATNAGLGHLRRIDPDAASDLDAVRRQPRRFPTVAVVGETKRGKSSLVNALLRTPNLSPVDAAVCTSAYLEFRHGPQTFARAFVGDQGPVALQASQLRDWGTVMGSLPEGARPPRNVEIYTPSALLQYVNVIDTPGVGGLDSLHGEIALEAVSEATALLFVVDASSPFSKPELDFLSEASKRVNCVLFALTKIDAYPGWRTVLDDNQALLQAHAPRFASAPFFPVSARLTELADTINEPGAAKELRKEARVGELRLSLKRIIADQAELLHFGNLLRAVRTELVLADTSLTDRMRATDPDPQTLAQLKEERAAFANRKRKDARTWTLTLSTETRRARTDATAALRAQIQQVQDQYLTIIEKAPTDRVKALPYELDRVMQGLSLRLSAELEHRFRGIGQRVLAEVFTDHELRMVLSQLNARLRSAVGSKPQRDAGGDQVMALMGAGGMSMMAGRGASMGVSAALGSSGAVAGLAIPVVGIGVGLAAAAFMLWRRKTSADRQGAKIWLKEVLSEARASLSDEIAHRFTELEYALAVALDEAVERRVQQLDQQIAGIDKSLADDKAARQKRKAALQADRDAIRSRVKQLDEVLNKARNLAQAQAAGAGGGRGGSGTA